MPLQVPPGYSQVSFVHNNLSPTGSKVVWSIGISAPPTDAYLDGFEQWWLDDMRPLCNPALILEKIEMRNEVEVRERLMSVAGSGTGDYIAPQITALIQKRTGLAGRQFRGRMNWPGVLRESDVDGGGTIIGSRIISIRGTTDSLMDLATSTGDELVLFHNASSDPTIITQLLPAGQTATLRRRNRK